MKFTIPLLLLIGLCTFSYGQSDINKTKSLYFEIGGSGGLGSINYERQFFEKNNTELLWRLGLSFAPIDRNNGTAIVFPAMIHALIGKSSHKLDLGLGQGITITTKGKPFFLTTAAVGYRFQSQNSKWFYRIGYTPLISYIVDFQLQHWGGISIGYTLN